MAYVTICDVKYFRLINFIIFKGKYMKISNLCFFAIASAFLAACHNGTAASPTPTPTPSPIPTSPVAMPTSTWVNTNLDTYLTANNLQKLNTALIADSTGIYTVVQEATTRQRAVLFYSTTTQTWSDITGNLTPYAFPINNMVTSGVSTNGNGTIYSATVNTVLSVYTGNSTWLNISLPSPSTTITSSAVEAQTRKLSTL